MSRQPPADDSARRIFDQALERPAGERQAFVREACGADEALRLQVEGLLKASDEAEAAFPELPEGEEAGDRIGPYKLLERIGQGGFGTVWMAEQEAPVRRRVALKVIKLGMDTRAVVARFEAERQALALMDHPYIAHVLEAGATAGGRPYFVMELVRGVPITQYCDEARLSTRERLELFQHVCEAVQHAHQKGIIHRDLKPGNVLVTLQDGKPVPKVIDFGIAKATSGQLTDKTLFTGLFQVLGTPLYMAPEQAELSAIDVDTRADVYSLGVMLYELLTGTRPFELPELVPLGVQEFLRRIREVEPEKPSTRVSSLGERLLEVCGRRRVHPRAFARLLHRELDWIVLKALEKERSRRYATADRLAADIGHYLRDEPVEAGPPSQLYRLRKNLRRHWVGASSAAAVALAICAGSVLSWHGYREARAQEAIALGEAARANEESKAATLAREEESRQRELAQAREAEAKREALRAERVVELLRSMVRGSDPHETKGPDYTLRELLEDLDRGLAQELADEPEVEATLREVMAESFLGLGLPKRAEPHVTRALELRQRISGPDRAMAYNMELQAQLLHDLGRYGEALAARRQALLLEDPESFGAGLLHTGAADLLIHLYDGAAAEEQVNQALRILRSGSLEEDDASTLSHSIARQLSKLLRYSEAETLQRERLEYCKRVHGTQSLEVADILSSLGWTLSHQGRYAEAEAAFGEALAQKRSLLGETHPEVATDSWALAQVLLEQNRFAEAESLLREAVRLARPDDPSRPEMLDDLAISLLWQNRLEEAESLHRQALETFRARDEEDVVKLGQCLINLAGIVQKQGKTEEAEALMREVLERAERQVDLDGQAAGLVRRCQWQLGWMLFELGRHAEAEPILRDLLGWLRGQAGHEMDISECSGVLGESLLRLGRLQEAEAVLREAVDLARRFDPEDTFAQVIEISRLGYVLLAQGRPADALPWLEEDVELCAAAVGRRNPQYAQSLENLAGGLCSLGRADEAEPLLEQALRIFRLSADVDHPQVEDCERKLALLLIEVGRHEQAADIASTQLERQRARLEPDDPMLASSLNVLARALLAAEPGSTEAEALLRECLELDWTKAKESWRKEVASTLLGSCLLAQGHVAESEPLLRAGAEGTSPISSSYEREYRREALLAMARWCEKAGRPDEAQTWRERLARLERGEER